ncbi:hypothetical protein ACRE_008120 [Hapsidospora chrysogenum ATCC 11550]|uniref:Gag1-like clamp domain-containing protein n=1 Tax=Hapsidospora chrysogenum (strain ATCC 11550 / CBS 779.69 / DSM 880 / IAM 14645 / JCM 23072 / IMI 49137) TaxID=857340 RepID=A0A086TFT7_HAPC1|nr:hypothetical protein ACRE_008120 [Hapsidospora chrysogenum ATCC 11550]
MFYKSHRTPLSKKLRPHHSHEVHDTPPTNAAPNWSSDEYAELVSRDKTKVKDAVRRYLSGKVRNDWVFHWPPVAVEDRPPTAQVESQPETLAPRDPANIQDEPNDEAGYQVDGDSDIAEEVAIDEDGDGHDTQSVYSVMSADPIHYKLRKDWDSDVPTDEPLHNGRSDSPGQGDVDPQIAQLERRAERRRQVREEMEWNEGLACFEARRNAWTQARTVRLRVKTETPQTASSQRPTRRFFFRRSTSSASSSQGTNSQSGASTVTVEGSPHGDSEKDPNKNHDKSSTSTASHASDVSCYPVETIVPAPPPILPPNNPLRATITSNNYLQLYDKLIINSLQPSCPVNLSDMIGACVAGWMRDGEWPPRPAVPIDATFASGGIARKKRRASIVNNNNNNNPTPGGRRLSLTKLLSRDKDTESQTGKGVRQSLQLAFGLGSSRPPHA